MLNLLYHKQHVTTVAARGVWGIFPHWRLCPQFFWILPLDAPTKNSGVATGYNPCNLQQGLVNLMSAGQVLL